MVRNVWRRWCASLSSRRGRVRLQPRVVRHSRLQSRLDFERLEDRTLLSTFYVDASFAGAASGSDPDGDGPATELGVDAFATIQAAVDAAEANAEADDVIIVSDGFYFENVTINEELTLLSESGRDSTFIFGLSGEGALGTITVGGGVAGLGVGEGVQIGAEGQGFTIIGIDNGNPAIENAAVYFQGNHSGAVVAGNEIVANGDLGLLTEYGATIENFTITDNIFSGKTFVGSQPAGDGFTTQFTEANVPRQLVAIGGGTGGGLTSNIIFTDNEITGVAGGINAAGNQQGNTLVTIDSNGATIEGNTFAGTTTRFGSALRARGEDTVIADNTFDAQFMSETTNILFLQGDGELSTGDDTIADVVAQNEFVGGVVLGDNGVAALSSIQAAIDASAAGASLAFSGDFTEDVDVNQNVTIGGNFNLDGSLTLSAAGATLDAGGEADSTAVISTGDLTLGTDTVLNADVDTLVAGLGHDQIQVNGEVEIQEGAELQLDIDSALAGLTAGSIVLVNNDGVDAVDGEFEGLAEGALIDGTNFRISYRGGDGNDIVLQAMVAPSIVYVDDAFSDLANGDVIVDADLELDGNQAATVGIDAFASLQDAINSVSSGGEIVVNGGTYVGNFTLAKDITIDGADDGSVIIDGNASGSVLTIGAYDVELSDLTIQNGLAVNGGGIASAGADLTLTDVTLSGNVATEAGGALHVDGGNVTLDSSVVSENSAQLGGGIAVEAGVVTATDTTLDANLAEVGAGAHVDGGELNLQNVTVSGNVASVSGGGVAVATGEANLSNVTISGNTAVQSGGGVYVSGDGATATVNIANSTIVLNSADLDGDSVGTGGGVHVAATALADVTLNNTLVAGNVEGSTSVEASDVIGTLNVSSSSNLIADVDTAGGLTAGVNGNIVGDAGASIAVEDLIELELADNGGETLTHALAEGSLAVDAGNVALAVGVDGDALSVDQRGELRIVNGLVDIGAVEGAGLTVEPGERGDVFVVQRGKFAVVSVADASLLHDLDIEFTSSGVIITGLNGTTIGGSESITLSGVTSLRGTLGDGNDDVTVTGTADQFILDLRGGENEVTFDAFTSNRLARVSARTGGIDVDATGSAFAQLQVFGGLDGDDSVSLENTTVLRRTQLQLFGGNADVDISGGAHNQFILNAAARSTSNIDLDVADVEIGNLTVVGGRIGDDVVDLSNVSVLKNANVRLNGGTDSVSVDGSTFGGNVNLVATGPNSSLNIETEANGLSTEFQRNVNIRLGSDAELNLDADGDNLTFQQSVNVNAVSPNAQLSLGNDVNFLGREPRLRNVDLV